MLTRFAVLLLATCAFLTAPASAAPAPGRSLPDAPYLEALRVADSFLDAWAQRDPDAGLALMSAALMAKGADSTRADLGSGLRQYMTGLSNPQHQGYEICSGRAAGTDRFAFPVRLFELYSGGSTGYSYSDTLGVVWETGKWRVDRLPRTYNPD